MTRALSERRGMFAPQYENSTRRQQLALPEAKLMQLSREWSSVAGSGNLDSTLSYWADDAVMMAPGQPPLKGKDAIRRFVEGSSAIPGFSVKWEPLEAHVSASGDMAYLVERNLLSFRDFDRLAEERVEQSRDRVAKAAGWLVEKRHRHVER